MIHLDGVALVMLTTGVGNVLWAGARIMPALRSVAWPSTEGEIVARDMDSSLVRYNPVVEYRYEVGGSEYRGHRISFAPTLTVSNADRALGAFHTYSPGRKVDVYYDPAHPDRSVLEPGMNWLLGGHLLAGLALLAFALL
jgi:hypothetical protein